MTEVNLFALFTKNSPENVESADLDYNLKREALIFYECFRKKKIFVSNFQVSLFPPELLADTRGIRLEVSNNQHPKVNEASLSLHLKIRGERERSPPLPEIMQSRFPHLGNSQGSA